MIIKKIQENQISYINAGINMKILSESTPKSQFYEKLVIERSRNAQFFNTLSLRLRSAFIIFLLFGVDTYLIKKIL